MTARNTPMKSDEGKTKKLREEIEKKTGKSPEELYEEREKRARFIQF